MMKKKQLFCIPYAGGTANFFSNLTKLLDKKIEVHALEYAGHGHRIRESFYQDVDAMIYDIAVQISNIRNTSMHYMVFGYSMGSLIAYEVLTRYFQNDPPFHVFLAAHEPPDIPSLGKMYAFLSDEDFINAMVSFGGIDERVKANKHFWDIYLPLMRADYRCLHEYRWKEDHAPLTSDITVFYSEEDTKKECMLQWGKHTTGNVTLEQFSGNHFFLKNHENEFASIILRIAAELENI